MQIYNIKVCRARAWDFSWLISQTDSGDTLPVYRRSTNKQPILNPTPYVEKSLFHMVFFTFNNIST